MIISQIQSVFSRHFMVSCLAIICGNVLALTAIYGFFPVLRHFIAGEDRVVENLSALFFLAAFVFALVLLRKKNGSQTTAHRGGRARARWLSGRGQFRWKDHRSGIPEILWGIL